MKLYMAFTAEHECFALPGNDIPCFQEAVEAVSSYIYCDVGFFAAGMTDNLEQVKPLAPDVAGLKLWLDSSFGNFLLTDARQVDAHFANWPTESPIVVHVEGGGKPSLGFILGLAAIYNRSVHVLPVARKDEIQLIRAAKDRGIQVTCETCPQYLYFAQEELPNLKPCLLDARPLIGTRKDREALWANIDIIDCIGSDHAPHLLSEKFGPNPVPGMPGLETSLAVMLTFVHQTRLSLDDVVMSMADIPRRIFHLQEQENTHIEIDPDEEWIVQDSDLLTKCRWSPFRGQRLIGRVKKVVLRGKTAFEQGEVQCCPGDGRIISFLLAL